MRLNRSELRVLLALRGGIRLQELEETLGISPSYASKLVSELEEKGLLDKRRKGKKIQLEPSDTKAVELLHRIRDRHSHIDWEELLSGKSVEILFYMDRPHTLSELAELSGNYRNTVYRILDRFQERGIIGKEDKRHTLNENFALLSDFAREYVHHIHRNTASKASDQYTIVWESVHTFLFQTSEEVKKADFQVTGTSKFQEYGIPLLTTEENYYFYTEEDKEIEAEDLVCHTLLIDRGIRYQSYCLLLIKKEGLKREELLDTAYWYDLKGVVENLLEYLETKGETEETEKELPSWDSFQQTADEYGVTV